MEKQGMGARRKTYSTGLLMDFKDILEQWEGGAVKGSTVSPKKALEEWLKNNEVYDKDAEAKKTFVPGEKRRKIINRKPDAIIDIHGLTKERAWVVLDQFFSDSKSNGLKKLRIIHGKGNRSKGEAVLQQIVKKYIEKCPFAGESGYEKAVNGGTGATWVLLK